VILAAGHRSHQRRALEGGSNSVTLQLIFMLIDAQGDIEREHYGRIDGLGADCGNGTQQQKRGEGQGGSRFHQAALSAGMRAKPRHPLPWRGSRTILIP